MTLYQQIYQNIPDLESLYRFEGFISQTIYDFNIREPLTKTNKYLYYSKNIKHHLYFVNSCVQLYD